MQFKNNLVCSDGMALDQRIIRAMVLLDETYPFYSSMLRYMEKVESDDPDMTMAVDTKHLYLGPKFIQSLKFGEMAFVIIHEILHVALMHVIRRGDRDNKLWNIACDLYVNRLIVTEHKLLKPGSSVKIDRLEIMFPNNLIYAERIDPNTDTVEELYRELEKQAGKNGYSERSKGGAGAPQPNKERTFEFDIRGEKIKIPDNYICDIGELGEITGLDESDVKKLIQQAMTESEMKSERTAGKGTLGLSRLIKKLLETKINWESILKHLIIIATSKDSSFKTPDKRMSYQRAIYPGQVSNELNTLPYFNVWIDTSGSIGVHELSGALGTLQKLAKTFKVRADIYYWDTEVYKGGEFKKVEDVIRAKPKGGGGTDANCVFEYISKVRNKEKPIFNIVITDGMFGKVSGTNYDKLFKDTVWLLHTEEQMKEFVPPFGKKYKYEIKK